MIERDGIFLDQGLTKLDEDKTSYDDDSYKSSSSESDQDKNNRKPKSKRRPRATNKIVAAVVSSLSDPTLISAVQHQAESDVCHAIQCRVCTDEVYAQYNTVPWIEEPCKWCTSGELSPILNDSSTLSPNSAYTPIGSIETP